ncbi:alpha/beta hydrolase [Nocardioides sp.]|uniref:alpha/beta fold hydrolase n=1 Tax=Nocardioides sp. TaxID=35761 RepID=UPI00262C9690|nr:alpha/beta hydrolase [Nocardioides sp.]MDI6912494.1 alpha/beta hydrolase [Nocardioides sp.]
MTPNVPAAVDASTASPYARLDVGDAQIAYRVVGRGDSVVLVHSGTGSGEFDWRYQIQVLAQHYRVVLLDLRGHARSSDGHISLETLTADIDAVCRHVDAYPSHFLAASHGTLPVLRLAMEAPGRARSVAIVGSVWRHDHLTADDDEDLFTRWPQALRRLHDQHGPGHWADLLRRLIEDRRTNVGFTEDDFRRLQCPLLVAQGHRDEFVEVAMSTQAATWGRGELLVLPAAGHAPHIEAPELFNLAYVEFLRRVEAEARTFVGPPSGVSGDERGQLDPDHDEQDQPGVSDS